MTMSAPKVSDGVALPLLRHSLELRTHVDDEYEFAGVKDPKILLTTSRDPSSRLTQFAKEMALVLPNSQRTNRGAHTVSELVETCRANEFTDLILLHETRGQPGACSLIYLTADPCKMLWLCAIFPMDPPHTSRS